MYIPKQFEETRVEAMHALIRAHPLATLVVHDTSGLNANHIPFFLSATPAPLGTLQGHVARANPLLAELSDGLDALAVFHGPQAYITPAWYATKRETGKVVPTWNYAVVHACGVLRVADDADWLRAQLGALTDHNEATLSEPWSVADAPPEYIEQRMAAIVGVEMVITRLLGKWKVSQNQPARNQQGVIAGLRASGREDADAMAALIEAGANKPG